MAKLRRLEKDDIHVLRRKRRAINEGFRLLRMQPLNERVRNALFTAGVHRLLADNVTSIETGELLLNDVWHTMQETLKCFFNNRQVDLTFNMLERAIDEELAEEGPEEE